MKTKRIGILTGGGDCPGLNAVIRAVTKSAIGRGFEVIGFRDGFEGFVRNDRVHLSQGMVSGILIQGGTILRTSNKANPYKWASKTKSGKFKFVDVSKRAIANYQKSGLSALVVIGGDGTMAIANKLYRDGLAVVGIPKTIDNDLPGTEVTFGFDSAVATASEAIDKVHTTAQSHKRVMVVEVMGRYAGWIALHSGIASGGDIILIPEIPYEMEHIYKKIHERDRLGRNFSIIVTAEGAKPKGGKMTVRRLVPESTDPVRLGGVGSKIAEQIEDDLGIDSRATVLGHVQRGGTPTPFDRILSTRFGTEAVELVMKGEFGRMVTYRRGDTSSVSLEQATGSLKLVPKDHPLIESARAIGTSFGDQ